MLPVDCAAHVYACPHTRWRVQAVSVGGLGGRTPAAPALHHPKQKAHPGIVCVYVGVYVGVFVGVLCCVYVCVYVCVVLCCVVVCCVVLCCVVLCVCVCSGWGVR